MQNAQDDILKRFETDYEERCNDVFKKKYSLENLLQKVKRFEDVLSEKISKEGISFHYMVSYDHSIIYKMSFGNSRFFFEEFLDEYMDEYDYGFTICGFKGDVYLNGTNGNFEEVVEYITKNI